jgi:hypothetical protein
LPTNGFTRIYSYISKHFAQSLVKISKLTTFDTAINLFRIEIQKRLNRKVWKRIRKKQYIKKGDVEFGGLWKLLFIGVLCVRSNLFLKVQQRHLAVSMPPGRPFSYATKRSALVLDTIGGVDGAGVYYLQYHHKIYSMSSENHTCNLYHTP